MGGGLQSARLLTFDLADEGSDGVEHAVQEAGDAVELGEAEAAVTGDTRDGARQTLQR